MYTPEKRNMSPENQWLEDVLPIQIVPYKGIYDIFQGCRCFWITRNLFFTQGLPTLLPALQVAAVWARKSGKHMRRWWGLVGWFLLFKFVVERYWNLGALLSSCVDSLLEKTRLSKYVIWWWIGLRNEKQEWIQHIQVGSSQLSLGLVLGVHVST